MFEKKKSYVLGIVFDYKLEEVLLLKRVNEPYSGRLNGIGGKVEHGEQFLEAMKREMFEETDIKLENVGKIEGLITFTRPNGASVNVFYILLNKTYKKKEQITIDEGILKWYHFINDNLYDVRNIKLASEGATAYFINYALSKEGVNTSTMQNS